VTGRINNFAAVETLSGTGLVSSTNFGLRLLDELKEPCGMVKQATNDLRASNRLRCASLDESSTSAASITKLSGLHELSRLHGLMEAPLRHNTIFHHESQLFSSNITLMLWKAGRDEVGEKEGGKLPLKTNFWSGVR
jgi:hypothetical protein